MCEKGLADRSLGLDDEGVVLMNNIKFAGANRENLAESGYKKETKMFNQVKRIIEMQDTSFKQLANALMEKEGKKVENVLNQMYKERES